MTRILKVGVIGTGRMGSWHAQNFRWRVPGAQLVAVADADKRAARRAAEKTGVRWFADYRKLLALRGLDAVCVVTSTDTHAPIAAEAAELGLNVFVEKPMATTVKDAERLSRTVRRKHVKLQVGFMRRFDPAYSYAKKKVDAGQIGKPLLFKSTSRDPFPPPPWACDPKHGGGLQLEMHTHDYDLARWFIKSEARDVFIKAECLVFPEIKRKLPAFVDTTLITLGFENRTLAIIDGSLNAKYGYDVRSEIYGTDGMISVGGLRAAPVKVLKTGEERLESTFLGDVEKPHFVQRFEAAYLGEMLHFVKTIQEDLPAEPSLVEGRAALEIGLAAFESTNKKKTIRVSRS